MSEVGPSAAPASAPSGGAPRASRRRLVALGAVFLLLAGLQVWAVLSRGAATLADAELTRLVLDPRAERWVLRDTGPAAEPVATAVHDAGGKRLVLAAPGLPTPRRGGVYVLWYLRPGGEAPEVAAAFRPTHEGVDLVLDDAPSARDLSGLLVTEEPTEARPARLDPSRVRARYGAER